MRVLYTVLLYLIVPLALLRLFWRGFQIRDYWHRWGERFGFGTAVEQPIAVWVHAVSVGEALAAMPLIHALIQQHGAGQVLVTTTTPTGSARVRAALGEQVRHVYAPYDLPGAVERLLDRMQPQRVVVMETELWPNLFAALKQRGIPLHIVNGRLSPRSFAGYSKVRGFAAEVLAACTGILAQSPEDAERFRALGADPQRVHPVGNIKFDQTLPDDQIRAGEQLRTQIGTAPVWLAASTHEGEDVQILEAHRQLLREHPGARLILVPRHPQRFEAVASLVERQQLPLQRRSQWQDGSTLPDGAVLLGDSMGEMFLYLAAADQVFVGGSLVPVGGHNVLEPAALGRPVLHGPHMHNFEAARDLLRAAQAAVEVADAAALAAALGRNCADPGGAQRRGRNGREAVEANRGTLQRILAHLQ